MPPVIGAVAAVASAATGAFAATATFLGVSQFALGATLLSTAASFGFSYMQQQAAKAQARKAQAGAAQVAGAVTPEAARQSLRQTVGGRRTAYGTVRVAGSVFFYETRSNFLTIGWAINQGFIDSVESIFLNGREVVLDQAGFVASAPWVLNGGKLISVEISLGQESKDYTSGIILGQYSDIWDTDHRLDGVAYVVMRFQGVGVEDFSKVYKNRVPDVAFTIRARRVFDPRDTTQDAADSTTWTYSDNAALCLADFLTRRDGFNLSKSALDMAALAVAADDCDDQIATKDGGAVRRYRVAGQYDLTSDPVDAIRGMLDAMAGTIDVNPANGLLRIRAGVWREPTVTLDASSIKRVSLSSKADAMLSFNTVKATYLSPDHDYTEQEAQPYQDEAHLARVGVARVEALPLAWVPEHQQARRLSKIAMISRNPRWSGSIVTDVSGLKAFGEEMIILNLDGPGIVEQTFRVNAARFDLASATCTFDVSWFPEYAFDWTPAGEDGDPPPVPPSGDDQSTIIPAPANLRVQVDSNQIARMRWTLFRAAADAAATYTAEMRYRVVGAPSWTSGALVGSEYGNTIAGVSSGVDYEWQVRAVNAAAGRFSDWSDTAEFVGDATTDDPGDIVAVNGEDGTGEVRLNATVTAEALGDTYTSGVEFQLRQSGSAIYTEAADYLSGVGYSYVKTGVAAGTYDVFARARNMAFRSGSWVAGGTVKSYAPAETGAPPPLGGGETGGSSGETVSSPAPTGGGSPSAEPPGGDAGNPTGTGLW